MITPALRLETVRAVWAAAAERQAAERLPAAAAAVAGNGQAAVAAHRDGTVFRLRCHQRPPLTSASLRIFKIQIYGILQSTA